MTNPTPAARFVETLDTIAPVICDDHGPADADNLYARLCDDNGGRTEDEWTAEETAAALDTLAGYVEGARPDLARDARSLAEDIRAEAEEAEAVAVEPYADLGHVSPVIARAEAIAEDAAVVLAHINATGVRFDSRRKIAEAEDFTFLRGGSSLAVPSKLVGVTAFQGDVARLGAALADLDALTPGAARSYPTRLHKGTDAKGRPVVVVMAETAPGSPSSLRALGMLADKHAAWMAPVLATNAAGAVTEETSPVRVYVTAVTGGTPDRPTRGVNVAIHGTADAVRAFYDAAAIEAHREDAYGAGSRVAVEALTV